MATRTCGGCDRPADHMRPWGVIQVPICAGCEELLRTRGADGAPLVHVAGEDAAGPQLLEDGDGELATADVLEDVQQSVDARDDGDALRGPSTEPALTAEDMERRQVDPEYDNWLRRQGR